MKKYLAVLTLAALLLIVGAGPSVSAQAEVIKNWSTSVIEPNPEFYPPITLCDGSDTADFVGGECEYKTHIVTDANGGFHYTLHSKCTFTYESPETGNIYEFIGAAQIAESTNVYTAVVHQRLVLPGPDNNTFISATFRTVVNANGEVTVDLFEFDEYCR